MSLAPSVEELLPDIEGHKHSHQQSDNSVFDFINNPPDDWPLPSDPNAIPISLLGSPEIVSPRNSLDRQTLPQRASSVTSNSSISSRVRRSSSVATDSSHRKRLSLNFPVAISTLNNRHALHSANSPVPGTPISTVNTDFDRLDPNDAGAFLTALAAQERKVLELREELTKAESELARLKRQWTIQEATRKRQELFQTAARPLQTDLEKGTGNGETPRMASPTFAEEQRLRRQAAMAKLVGAVHCSRLATSGGRKVTSQRHQRALSLLSPQRPSYPLPFAQDVLSEEDLKIRSISRAETLPLPSRPSSIIIDNPHRKSQDILLQTGKQMAEDFKEGLWNFIEDLRQATVGDDCHQNPRQLHSNSKSSSLRKEGSKTSLRSNSSSTGGRARSPNTQTKRQKELKSAKDLDDAWETASTEAQDAAEQNGHNKSTNARWSTGTEQSDIGSLSSATHSRSSTPRTSTSSVQSTYVDNLNSAGIQIPLWGPIMSAPSALPFNLKRTATAIISHVEKTLATPLPSALPNERVKTEEKTTTGKSTAISAGDLSCSRANSPAISKSKNV